MLCYFFASSRKLFRPRCSARRRSLSLVDSNHKHIEPYIFHISVRAHSLLRIRNCVHTSNPYFIKGSSGCCSNDSFLLQLGRAECFQMDCSRGFFLFTRRRRSSTAVCVSKAFEWHQYEESPGAILRDTLMWKYEINSLYGRGILTDRYVYSDWNAYDASIVFEFLAFIFFIALAIKRKSEANGKK